MRLEFYDDNYIRGCIRTCQQKGHIQQVAFSTYHDGLTQICFTCGEVRTSINCEEIKGSKKAKPLNHFDKLNERRTRNDKKN